MSNTEKQLLDGKLPDASACSVGLSETPRSDNVKHDVGNLAMLCRKLERELGVMRDALEMVRDADEDCKKDELKNIPSIARSSIDNALIPPNAHVQTSPTKADQ